MRKYGILFFFLLVPAFAFGQTSDLLFSEYVEGSSNNKALEIYNGTGAEVDLTNYTIERYNNGAKDVPDGTLALVDVAPTLADGEVLVVVNGSADQALLDVADYSQGDITFFNGDDALVLQNNGVTIDVIGEVGFDPGSEWGTGDISTQNNTLRRMDSACNGDTNESDAFDPAVNYEGFPQDTFDGLGAHTANCSATGGGGTNTPPSAVTVLKPADGLTFRIEGSGLDSLTFAWSMATDDDGDTVEYIYQVGADATFTVLLGEAEGEEISTDTTAFFYYYDLDNFLMESDVAVEGSLDLYFRVMATDGVDTTASTNFVKATLVRTAGVDFNIADARSLPLGSYVPLTGIVTRAMGDFVRIQDDWGGMAIRQPSGNFFDMVASGDIAEGDSITIVGSTSEFASLMEINEGDLDTFWVMSRGNTLPEPKLLTLAEVGTDGEQWESMLITVKNVSIETTDVTFADATTYTISDATLSDGSVSLRIPNADDTETDGMTIPAADIDYLGVLGQFDFGDGTVGYQLAPVDAADITEATGVATESIELPDAFVLEGNYPNPFNPTTTLRFDLPETADVTVKIFDVTGRLVTALPTATIQAGFSRTLSVDGASLASGLYFYQISAQGKNKTFNSTGKMILLK